MIDRTMRADYRRWLDTLEEPQTSNKWQGSGASGPSGASGASEASAPSDARRTQPPTAQGAFLRDRAALPEVPARLPFAGHVVWFYESRTYLDIRFDHHRFEIITQQVRGAAEAFYFDSFDAAYGHAADVGEPCLILLSEGDGTPVSVVG